MRYEDIKDYTDDKFKRITGVRKGTYDSLVSIVKETIINTLKKYKEGRNNKLSIEDMVLIMLDYYRNYDTY